jgi:hypothetical protein
MALLAALAAVFATAGGTTLAPIQQSCRLSVGEKIGTLRLETGNDDCEGGKHCGTNMSDVPENRFMGISVADLAENHTQVTATIDAEAGKFSCTGAIKERALTGSSVFTPNSDFVARMEKMGFSGYDSRMLLAYALLDVQSGWAQSLKDLGIRGLDSGNLIALRVFNADPDYVRSMTALGYGLPDAGELINMRVQGVNAKEVAEFRALGYQPTLEQLVQIRIFKVTPEFIRRMQARGLKNLTIEKLVQIRIFNLAD